MWLGMTFLGLSVQVWIIIFITLGMFYMLVRTRVPAEVIFLGAVTILLVTNVVSENNVLDAFGSEAILVNGAFYIVIAGLMTSGVLYWIGKHLLGTPSTYRRAVVKLMVPVSVLSAMLGCENAVSLFTEMVKMWARKLGISPAKLLIPLSYAATFGGMCTLLGQSSNLIIAGLYVDLTGTPMNLFAPVIPGLACTLVGIAFMTVLRRFLPDRESPEVSFENISDYTVELLVPTDNDAVAQTVHEAGLKEVRGGSLIEIVRFDKEVISPVSDDEYIFGGDRLIYSGQINEILELKQSHGLVAADHHVYNISEIDNNRKLRTAYVNFGSDLIGTCMSKSSFERRNDMVLVAVARQGKRVDQQPREVVLAAGDTLLLECPPKKDSEIENNFKRSLTFFDSQFIPQLGPHTIISAAILIIMFILSSFKVMSLLTCTMVAAGASLIFRCCRMTKIVKYIDWNFLLVLGSLVVFSTAITNTGVVTRIADVILNLCNNNPYIIITVMCVIASLASEFTSNVAMGAVFFPIVYQQALLLGCNPMPFVIAIMTAVSISYCTPIGSSTIMMIYGPGGFKFTDFWRIGIWMHLLMLIVDLVTIFLFFPLY